MSLTGSTTSIETVTFNNSEDSIASGVVSGSIRIWDLEKARLSRALSGHAATVRTLEFHQSDRFLASGSSDTTIKLWDLTRKGCINTYNAHSGFVTDLKFSPDGKWLASAHYEGNIKVTGPQIYEICTSIWNLATGKPIADLTGHESSITSIAFHPNVLLLASAAADRTVRIWDLETFEIVARSSVELGPLPVRKLSFHPDGPCLYCATPDFLKVIYNYESMECIESIPTNWRQSGNLVDMAVMQPFNHFVGVCVSHSTVSTYIVDIKSCAPFNSDSLTTTLVSSDDPKPAPASPPVIKACTVQSKINSEQKPKSTPQRKSFGLTIDKNIIEAEDNLPSSTMACSNSHNSSDNDSESAVTSVASPTSSSGIGASIEDPVEYQRIFGSRSKLRHSPPRPGQQQQQQPTSTTKILPKPAPTRRPITPSLPSKRPDSKLSSTSLHLFRFRSH
ncbi:hypothetical protein Ciccas_006164 [Cichlidogyrus casuarinus]|uniref:Uncharacterized protein n=1 Tax=Cichlidogyrus casuarinus TaxID=1844966 RepID=A0ABD2Q6L5_9PLAT